MTMHLHIKSRTIKHGRKHDNLHFAFDMDMIIEFQILKLQSYRDMTVHLNRKTRESHLSEGPIDYIIDTESLLQLRLT